MNQIEAQVTVAYDYDGSSRNFEDNFKLSPMRAYRNIGINLYQYIDWGNVKLIDRVEDLFTIKTKSRHVLYKFVDLDEEERKEYSVEELHDEILSNYDFDDLDDFAENEIDDIKIERHYSLMTTIGYSQGDYTEVLVLDESLITQKEIDDIFWDTPIYFRVDLNLNNTQVEIHDWEMDIDQYWDYPFDIDKAKEITLNYIKEMYKNVAAVDKIVAAVDDAFPTEVYMPKC